MATRKSQRIFIWVIAIIMAVGTLGAYFAMILANQNQESDVARDQQLLEDYTKQMKANNLPLDGYNAEKFNANDVTVFKAEDLVAGQGAEATKDSKVTMSYFGWTSDGSIFDSSNKKDKSGQPFSFKLAEGGVIKGWIQGIPGMKVGGVRKLTIPADLAYGSAGSPPLIPANSPLVFIVKLEKVE